MTRLLATVELSSRGGRRALARLADRNREVLDPGLTRQVERIVRSVRRKGDAALLEAVHRFDHLAAGLTTLPPTVAAVRLPVPAAAEVAASLPPGFAGALEVSIEAVEVYHRRQVHPGYRMDADGVELVERRLPLARVACYVPGGRASYPSTAVMTVVPARVAGVPEVVVMTPPASWHANPALRYTLARLGVEEVWGMGGAHAVAALAYGTATVPRADKIVGPGNAWVTAAKRRVAGDVAIDGIAGPSEVVVVADGDADPGLLAADLLAQAEHDPRAAAILVTRDSRLARAVEGELEAQLPALSTAAVARESLRTFGTAFLVADLDEALAVVEALAPEHLQLVGPGAEGLAERVERSGAVFVGAATGEVFGDYVAGPSHVLPTGGSARFASALGVEDFVRRSHTIRLDQAAAGRLAPSAAVLADAEGLPAHAAAARRRLL